MTEKQFSGKSKENRGNRVTQSFCKQKTHSGICEFFLCKKKANIMGRTTNSRRLHHRSRLPSYARKCRRNIAFKCHQKPTVSPFEFDLNFVEVQSDYSMSDREPIRSENFESQSEHVLKNFINILETWFTPTPGVCGEI